MDSVTSWTMRLESRRSSDGDRGAMSEYHGSYRIRTMRTHMYVHICNIYIYDVVIRNGTQHDSPKVGMMHPMLNILLLSREEVIQDGNFMSLLHQFIHQMTSYKSCSASYENFLLLAIGNLGRFHNVRRGGRWEGLRG